MTDFKIVASNCGDWEALYADGKLIDEWYSLSIYHVLIMLNKSGILPNRVEFLNIFDETIERELPKDLKDLDLDN